MSIFLCPRLYRTTIRKDMEKWKTTSMWPLSCYGNLHGVPYLPGLVEVSPEEMRFEAYKVNSSETSAEFLRNVEELCSQQAAMISKYSDLTLEDMKELVSARQSCVIYNSKCVHLSFYRKGILAS